MESLSEMNGGMKYSPDDMQVDIEFDKNHETEVLRIISQYLIEKGLNESAKTLQRETGVALEGEVIQNLRNLVLDGKFDEAVQLIYEIEYDPARICKVKQAVYEQKYLELLEKGDVLKALDWLRGELIVSTKEMDEIGSINDRQESTKDKIKTLSSLIMWKSIDEIKNIIDWDGAEGKSRKKLLDILQSHISPQKMLENGRLEYLLKQSIAFQVNGWKFHDWDRKDHAYSLLEKHKCK